MTVRNFSSSWKHSPLSMAQQRSSVVEHVAGLAVGVVRHDVKGRELGEPVVELGVVRASVK